METNNVLLNRDIPFNGQAFKILSTDLKAMLNHLVQQLNTATGAFICMSHLRNLCTH